MSDTPEKVNKTKVLLALKTELTDVRQELDVEKAKVDKLQKRLAQVGPALDAMKEGFNGELARLRDEVADESQILMKVVSWIRDKLDGKIDGKIETAREQWTTHMQGVVLETEARVRKDVGEAAEDERAKSDARWTEAEARHKTELELVKEEAARALAAAKDQWQQERIQLETQMQTLHNAHMEYLQNQFQAFEAESKLLVATEVDKAATEKILQTEEKLHVIQNAQSEKLRAEFQKSSDDFRELLKMDLALLRNDERLLWEKERQAIREEERRFRESVRATIVEEISRFQVDALNVISAAQEELAKRKAKGFVEEESTEGTNGNKEKEDELFAIGKELSEKHIKREKEIQTNKMKIQPDSLLRRFGDDEEGLEASQQRRDEEQRKVLDLREKEEEDRKREDQEMRAKEEEIRKERDRLENIRKQMEINQKREKEEAAQRQREEDQRKEKERAEQIQKIEEERAEKLQQLRKQREEDSKKEKERQEELKKHREEEERKLEELKRQNQAEREEREREFARAQQRREHEQAEREREAELKLEEEQRKKRERKEAEERDRLEKEREREERDRVAQQEKEEQDRLKREKKERKLRERQEQEERERLERERLLEEEDQEIREKAAREEEINRRQDEEREEKARKKKLEQEKKKQEQDKKQKEREEKEKRAQEEHERERLLAEEKVRKAREEEEEEERREEERQEEERREKERKEQERKEKERKREQEKKQKEAEKKKKDEEAARKKKEAEETEEEEKKKELLTSPSKPKRIARPPTSTTPQIPTRDTTDDDDLDVPAPTATTTTKPTVQRAGSVSVLPPAPAKTLKKTSDEKITPAKKEDSSREASTGECDVSDPDVQNAWREVRSDSSSTNWFILGYGGSKNKLELYGSGSGGIAEFQKNLKNEILYGYIRVSYGDNSQAKFVFVTYFPENISMIARARTNPHKAIVDKFVKIYNVQIAATTPEEVGEDVILPKLRAAGGASYGSANTALTQAKPSSSSSSSSSSKYEVAAAPSSNKDSQKKEDDKKKKEEEKKKEDERRAKEEAERKKQEDEKRKKEDERKKEEDSKRKLKEKEDSFATYVGVGKAKEGPPTGAGAGATGAKNTCAVCGKTVYLTEKIEADNKTYHKTCFRCSHCNNIIKLGNFAALNGKLYCKPHFKQLFASKGNYNEGFGKQKLTHEWAAKKGAGGSTDSDDEDEEEEEEKPAPVKSAPPPAKSQPVATPTPTPTPTPAPAPTPVSSSQKEASKPAASPSPAPSAQKKSDISNIYSSIVKDNKAAPPAKAKPGNKDVLKSTLFDSDEEEDALFK